MSIEHMEMSLPPLSVPSMSGQAANVTSILELSVQLSMCDGGFWQSVANVPRLYENLYGGDSKGQGMGTVSSTRNIVRSGSSPLISWHNSSSGSVTKQLPNETNDSLLILTAIKYSYESTWATAYWHFCSCHLTHNMLQTCTVSPDSATKHTTHFQTFF